MARSGTNTAAINPETIFFGEGLLGNRIREFDWASTSLGPIFRWSQPLATTVQICLGSAFPAFVWWGSETVGIYNAEFAKIFGTQYSIPFGRSSRTAENEIWETIRPHADRILQGVESSWNGSLSLVLNRNGFPEESHFSISISVVLDEYGESAGILGLCNEDTEKVQNRRRTRTFVSLRESLKDCSSIDRVGRSVSSVLAENTNDSPFSLLYSFDRDGSHLRLVSATGIARGTIASPTVIDVHGKSYWPFQAVLESGRTEEVNIRHVKSSAQGEAAWPESISKACVVPLSSPISGGAIGFLITGISSTIRWNDSYKCFLENVAASIAIALENARTADAHAHSSESQFRIDKTRTSFFASLSHEFQTPLTLMLGPIEELLSRTGPSAFSTAKDQLEIVNRNCMRLMRLVNSLLDFSRIDSGRIQATYEPTRLSELTKHLANLFRSTIEKAGLQFQVECGESDQVVFVDRGMWEKIVLNLISNAFKFTHQGDIEVRLQVPSNRIASRHIELSVRDTGIGIHNSDLPYLFDRFHRVADAHGRSFEGCGVGLAIVQELVWLHGGTVRVESEWGKGSTFYVSLPLGCAHLPARAIGPPRAAATLAEISTPILDEAKHWAANQKITVPILRDSRSLDANTPKKSATPASSKILIVDDNPDMRRYLTMLLSDQFVTETAPDGLAALAIAESFRPDLIVSDIMMPTLDGFGLVRQLRQDAGLKDIPIILVSALPAEESRVEGIEIGADDYLIKPFSPKELVARVQSHLERAKRNREITDALSESEKRYRLLFESMLDGVAFCRILTDSSGAPNDWIFIDSNPAFRKLVGAEDILGKRASMVFQNFGESNAELLTAFGRVVTTGASEEFEGYLTLLGRWIRISITSPVKDHFIAIIEDISQRKLTEIALRESDERYRSLFNSS